jgi:hypothetical protein
MVAGHSGGGRHGAGADAFARSPPASSEATRTTETTAALAAVAATAAITKNVVICFLLQPKLYERSVFEGRRGAVAAASGDRSEPDTSSCMDCGTLGGVGRSWSMRCSVVALGLLGVLTLASGAEATDRLKPVRDFPEAFPDSAGNALVWTTAAGVVMVADDRARVRHRFRAGPRCLAVDTTRFGEALVGCSTNEDDLLEQSYILDTKSGRARKVALPGAPHELGRRWIKTIDNPQRCYHCESVVYINRRTGYSRTYHGMDDPEFDLDGQRLRTPPGGINTVVYEGRRWLAERMRAGHEQLWLHAGGRRRLVATCPRYCWAEHLEGGRVAYVSGSDLDAGVLYDLNLRSGRTRSWRVPRRLWSEWPLRVGGVLFMLSERRHAWRLWRAA